MTIPDLIERLEKATGPDRELDEMISATLFSEHEFMQLKDAPEGVGCMMYRWPDGQQVSVLRATSSIDAAVKLCELKLPEHTWGINPTAANVYDGDPHQGFAVYHKTAPIALCIAILRALQAKEGE